MTEPHTPTTLPSPVDRGEFHFVAVDAAGETWRWRDEELVWERERPAGEVDNVDAPVVVH